MSIDITHLHQWAYSSGNDGARSPANRRFLCGLLSGGSLADAPGVTISVDQTEEQKSLVCLRFHLPDAYHSNGVESISILIPATCVGTGIFQPNLVFYALLEEIIGWLARVGPKNTLVRLYHQNHGQPLIHSYPLDWQQLHSGFTLFIDSLRHSHDSFPGLGQISGSFGVIEVAQATTSSGQASADYVVTLTLSSKQSMSLFLPRSVARLPNDWLLDWLEVQNEFSSRVQ